MEIVNKRISELVPYEKNPRKNDGATDYVANSIKAFGFKVPIIIDKNNVIVAGHTRYRASQKLGLKEVPCIIADDLSEEQIKAYRLADNKVSELAEWDFGMLNQELDEILNIDMEDFGFDLFGEEDFDTDFSLKDGDKEPIITMSITLSEEQAKTIEDAISQMKKTDKYKYYIDDYNKNSNGNALFLVVDEWVQQKILQ